MKHIVPVMAVATVLTLGAWTTLSAEEEKEESNYEAVIEKDGKQTSVEVSADGKVVSRHDESKEHKEKGE